MANIVTLPNPILHQKSEKVSLNKETFNLVKELKETLTNKEGIKGVGISAVQVGKLKKVFIAYSKSSKKFLTFINPEIVWKSKTLVTGVPESSNKYEGCLSVPDVWSIIKRYKIIKVRYFTENGVKQIRKFSGLTSTIIQHEFDHTEGVLFIDRALQQKSPLYEMAKNEKGKEYLKEIKLI